MNDYNNFNASKIILAKWKDRFFAWIIDFIIISLMSTSIFFISFQYLNQNFEEFITNDGMYVPTSILFFSYWIVLEYKTGQTLGKKIFNLKITSIDGTKPDLISIILSSFGKSFILPLDIILGLIFSNDKRQRIFNKLGRTIIIKIKESNENSDIKYIKD